MNTDSQIVTRIGHGAKLPRNCSGFIHTLEFAMAFADWANKQEPITHTAIMRRWRVSRATAFRYLAAYRALKEREAMRGKA